MANVPDSSLKTWNDGDTLHASDYDQDRSILQVAINDNNTRVGNVETKTKNIATDGSDYTGTWKGFSVDQVKNLATSTKSKTWIASSGQTVFTLGTSDDPYVVGNNSTELLIGGVPQTVGEGYTETNTTTITTSEGIDSGVEVTLRYQLTMAVTDTPISQLIGYTGMATQAWVESFGLGTNVPNVPGDNLDTLETTGFYQTTATTTSSPSTSLWVVQHINRTSSDAVQIATHVSGDDTRRRYKNSGTWSAWVKSPTLNDFVSSLSNSGYLQLPGGLIIQWGKLASVPSGVLTNTNLPIPFPNNFFQAAPSVINATGPCGWNPTSLSQIGLIQTNGSARDMSFIAIGN